MGKTKTVGKDREGNYHPPKGKPSGIDKTEGLGLQATDPDKLDQYLDVSDKYTTGEDQLNDNVTVRHPNRNVNKRNDALRENTIKGKQQSEESDKSRNETFAEPLTDTVATELPAILSKEILAQLKAITGERCISIYLPTHAAGVEVNEGQDAIRYKHLLQQAAEELSANGYDEGRIKRWLKPAYDLYRDDAFWKRQSQGLALFATDNYCSYLHLRQAPVEKVYINKHFALGPLAAQLFRPEYFYLLVISKKQATLFRGDDYGMHVVPVENMPGSETVAPWEDATNPIPDNEFYGISGSKTDAALYFKQVSDAIKRAVLNQEHVPLVLAGVDSVTSVYRSVTDYPYVWEETLAGNHEQDDTSSLYARVRPLLQPWFEQREHKALQLYRNLSATARTSVNLADIVPATHYGRVSHLFVVNDGQLWGSFDEQENRLTIDGESNGANEDLIDQAVTNTLLTGGEVFYLSRTKMPERSDMAAIFRYEQA